MARNRSHSRAPKRQREIEQPSGPAQSNVVKPSLSLAQQHGWDRPDPIQVTKQERLFALAKSFERLIELDQPEFSVNGLDGYRRRRLETRGKKPKRDSEYIDPPTGIPTTWDANSIQQALEEHYLAQFHSSAYLVDAMVGDSRVSHAINARTKGVLKRQCYITPNKRARDQKQAKYVADHFQEIWYDLFPIETQEQIWLWSSMMGWFLGNMIWAPGAEDTYMPSIKFWHPAYQFFLMAGMPEQRRFQAITMGGGSENRGGMNVPIEIGDPEWFLYAPYSAPIEHGYRTWVRGAIRQVGIPYLVRNYALRDFSRFSELMGIPLRAINVPANALEDDKATIFQQIVNQSSEAIVVLPQAEDGTGYQYQFVESKNAEGHKVFKELAARCDSDIELSIVGTALLSSMGSSDSKTGSFASSKTVQHENYDYADADALKFCGLVRKQVITPLTVYNYEDGEDLVPLIQLSDEPPQEKAESAKVWLDVSQALLNFQTLGAQVDLNETKETFEIPFTSDELHPEPGLASEAFDNVPRLGTHARLVYDRCVHLRKTTQLQSLILSKDQFDLQTAKQWCQAHGYKTEVDETADSYRFRQRDPGDFIKKSFRTIEFTKGVKAVVGKLRPSDGSEDEETQTGTESHARRRGAIRQRELHAEAGQEYLDKVSEHAIGHGIHAMQPHLQQVLAAVGAAHNPEELRQTLKRLARGIKRGTLQAMLQNSRLMANMAGRSTGRE